MNEEGSIQQLQVRVCLTRYLYLFYSVISKAILNLANVPYVSSTQVPDLVTYW